MKKYIVNLFIALSFQAVYCGEPVIPATNGQVRTFRAVFAKEIKEQACQFEAIGIFVFINKLVSGQMTPQQKDTFEKLGANPIQIAEAVRLGYGFDRGVCSDLVVRPTEMASYKTALTGIGKHVSNKSKQAEEKHVFTTNASQAAIAAHLNFSNSLMYKAEESAVTASDHVKFMYAHAKIAGDKDLERSIDSTPTEIEALREKAVNFLAPLFSTSIEHLRRFDTSMLQRIGEFSEDEERYFKLILSNHGADVHDEMEEAERESDENKERDFQSMLSNPGADVHDRIDRALFKFFGVRDGVKPDSETQKKILIRRQKTCFDILVASGLINNLENPFQELKGLDFTSLLTLCAYRDIPEIRTDFSRLTLLTGQKIPEHERKAGAGAGNDFSHLTFLTEQNIPEFKDSRRDIAQRDEKRRTERQQKYDDLDIDIINMSLELTDDEFENCYVRSLEEKKDELGYYPSLNTDRLKRSIRNILSSKIR
jgi:hypothetical protein